MSGTTGTISAPSGGLKVKRIRTWRTRIRLFREYLTRLSGLKGNN